MSNHIGRSIKNNPVEWVLIALLIIMFVVTVSVNLDNRIDALEQKCIIEAVPVQQ